MTEFKEPTRLREVTERMEKEKGPDAVASDSLRQALHALGAVGPDAASMQRMREGLGTGMANGGGSLAPNASPIATTFGRFAMLANTKGWLSLLLLTAASAAVWRSVGSETERAQPVAAMPAPDKQTSAVVDEASAMDAPPPPSAAEDDEPAPKRRVRSDVTKRQAIPRPHFTRLRSNVRSNEEVVTRVDVASAVPDVPPQPAPIEAAAAPAKPAAIAATRAEVPAPRPVADAVQPPPHDERAAPLDEPSLLQLARKRSSVEPEEALQLLAEHARRFPKGSLVQEREVLAIQVLRELGRTANANARLAAFAHKFPDSVYLSQLH